MANVVFVTLKAGGEGGCVKMTLYLSNEERKEDETWYAYGTLYGGWGKMGIK